MTETFEIGFYEFIRSELGGLESRIDKRFVEFEARSDKRFSEFEARTDKRLSESEARTDKRFDQMDARFNKLETDVGLRFNKLEEEVRWPRRIAIGGAITTVVAVIFVIFGFKG